VILRYRTAKSPFPAFSVPRGVVWARQQTLCTARCGTVLHRAVCTAAGGTAYRRIIPSYGAVHVQEIVIPHGNGKRLVTLFCLVSTSKDAEIRKEKKIMRETNMMIPQYILDIIQSLNQKRTIYMAAEIYDRSTKRILRSRIVTLKN
jgi:hypothetical protein